MGFRERGLALGGGPWYSLSYRTNHLSSPLQIYQGQYFSPIDANAYDICKSTLLLLIRRRFRTLLLSRTRA